MVLGKAGTEGVVGVGGGVLQESWQYGKAGTDCVRCWYQPPLEFTKIYKNEPEPEGVGAPIRFKFKDYAPRVFRVRFGAAAVCPYASLVLTAGTCYQELRHLFGVDDDHCTRRSAMVLRFGLPVWY